MRVLWIITLKLINFSYKSELKRENKRLSIFLVYVSQTSAFWITTILIISLFLNSSLNWWMDLEYLWNERMTKFKLTETGFLSYFKYFELLTLNHVTSISKVRRIFLLKVNQLWLLLEMWKTFSRKDKIMILYTCR